MKLYSSEIFICVSKGTNGVEVCISYYLTVDPLNSCFYFAHNVVSYIFFKDIAVRIIWKNILQYSQIFDIEWKIVFLKFSNQVKSFLFKTKIIFNVNSVINSSGNNIKVGCKKIK